MLLFRITTVPFRVARFVGYRRLVLFGLGVAVGALVTPISGPELRRMITAQIAKRRAGSQPGIEEKVRAHLAKSPRTWHLPQPEVVAVALVEDAGWQIILAGEVPDDDAKRDLELATLSIAGVELVDNRLRVVEQSSSEENN